MKLLNRLGFAQVMGASANQSPLVAHVWHDNNKNSMQRLRHVALAMVGVLLLWVSARVSIPFYPVPMTLQTMVLLAIAMSYGRRLAVATVATYVLVGLTGLPVFSGTPERGIGLAYMLGPTGGYLLGFIVATWMVSSLAHRGWGKTIVSSVCAMVMGYAIIYLMGISWLGYVIGWDKPLFSLGVLPFLYGDIIKIIIVSMGLPALWRLFQHS